MWLDKIDLVSPELVVANRQKFSELCNVTSVVVGPHPRVRGRGNKWNKIAWMIDLLRTFDTVVWIDFDAFVVQPECAWMHAAGHGVRIAADDKVPQKWNSGVMVVRSVALLKQVWRHNDGGRGVSDQNSINHVLRRDAFRDVLALSARYNAFPQPPRACDGYVPPSWTRQTDAVVRHYAGEYMGARTSDGKVAACAWAQLNVTRDAYALHRFRTPTPPLVALPRTAVLTSIVR